MNGGCRMQVNSQLPLGERLSVTARLRSIDDDGRRVVLQQHVVTGTADQPEAVVADFFAIVPLPRKRDDGAQAEAAGDKRPRKDKPRVPAGAREIGFWRLPANAGLDFAKLTGDFNPIHWIPRYARASGFRNVILHGFSTMARAAEGLNRGLFAGS